jgi:hypothetical protein
MTPEEVFEEMNAGRHSSKGDLQWKVLLTIRAVYKNTSIKNKLLLLFYIQIVIPLFFIVITSYQKSAEIIEQKSINYSLDILK